MDNASFRRLSVQLGALTRGQRRRLRSALDRLDAAARVAAPQRVESRPSPRQATGRGNADRGRGIAEVAPTGPACGDCAPSAPGIDIAGGSPAAGTAVRWSGAGGTDSAAGTSGARASDSRQPGSGQDSCHRCGAAELRPWGRTEAGRARRRCPRCGRTRSVPGEATTPSPDPAIAAPRATRAGTRSSPRLRHPEAFARLHADMLDAPRPGTCRALAAALAVDKMTVWRWRRRIIRALREATARPAETRCAFGADTATSFVLPVVTRRLRESRKASREWVDHRQAPLAVPAPDRPRWVDVDRGAPLPRPLWRHQHIVALDIDAAGRCRSTVVPADPPAAAWPASAAAALALGPRPDGPPGREQGLDRARDALPAPTCRHVEGARSFEPSRKAGAAAAINGRHHGAGPLRPPLAAPDAGPPGDALPQRFELFLRPFRGPAARYLDGYGAWFAARVDRTNGRS